MRKETGVSERIGLLVDYFADGVNTRFAELTGTSEANIRNYKNGKMPKLDFIYNVCSVFEINYEWILTGKGDMLKVESSVEADLGEVVKQSNADEEQEGLYDKELTRMTVENNSKLADANVKLATANLILAETNARLSQEILNYKDAGKDVSRSAGVV